METYLSLCLAEAPYTACAEGAQCGGAHAHMPACAHTQTLAHAHADARVVNAVVAIIIVTVASTTAATNTYLASAWHNSRSSLSRGQALHCALRHVTP